MVAHDLPHLNGHVNGHSGGALEDLNDYANGYSNDYTNSIPNANIYNPRVRGAEVSNEGPNPRQTPIAVVGLACRLPGHIKTPKALQDFLERGGIADHKPPASRFNLNGHFDGSKKPHTMRSPGGMFIEDFDPHDFDAQFFNITTVDAVAMDPQQRQLLEVVYECLENSGTPLESVSEAKIGCFVGSYAVGK
jgi:hypothetical protein